MTAQLAYDIKGAAAAANQSVDTIKRALRATDPRMFPPPLRAKRAGTSGNAKHLILASELERWLSSFPDA